MAGVDVSGPQAGKSAAWLPAAGTRFGRWTVVGDGPAETARFVRVLCRCDCGTEKSVIVDSLKTGRSRSCGCGRGNYRVEVPAVGTRFGRWTVDEDRTADQRPHMLACLCECGTRQQVRLAALRQGLSTSCGCGGPERQPRQRMDANAAFVERFGRQPRATRRDLAWLAAWTPDAARVEELSVFIAREGRWPRESTPAERTLARWVLRHRDGDIAASAEVRKRWKQLMEQRP